MTSSERPSKRHAFLALLREGWTSLHLDARRPGVVVPANLKREAHLVLQYGHDLPIPIPDLEVDDYGVRATLSFSRTAHVTVVPWSAVYVVACDDGRGVLYTEDVPNDVAVISARPKAPGDAVGDALPETDAELSPEGQSEGQTIEGEMMKGELRMPARSTRLRSIPVDAVPVAAEAGGGIAMAAEPMARRRRRPQLRLVK
jgi:stringent starvation protein B